MPYAVLKKFGDDNANLPLGGEPTEADRRVLADLVHAQRRRDDQAIGVGFGDHAADQAASDAFRSRPTAGR